MRQQANLTARAIDQERFIYGLKIIGTTVFFFAATVILTVASSN